MNINTSNQLYNNIRKLIIFVKFPTQTNMSQNDRIKNLEENVADINRLLNTIAKVLLKSVETSDKNFSSIKKSIEQLEDNIDLLHKDTKSEFKDVKVELSSWGRTRNYSTFY